MRHHTKTIGDLGVLKAQLDLYQKGYIVSVPLTEHAPFDLVVTKDGISRTVQVKARSVSSAGTIEVKLSSVWKHRNRVQRVQTNIQYVDIYCVYCLATDECYYFDPKDVRSSIKLRVRTPKNNQRIGIISISDYTEVP